MFDIGWTELMVIGVVALVVIGPKDLPDMFRTMGRFTAKARSMARDFQRAMEAAADDAGVKDVAKDLKTITSARNTGLDAVKNAASKFEKWDPMKPAQKAAPPAPTAAAPAPAAAAPTPAAAAPVPVAAEVKPAVPMGPATQALADAQAAKRAARAKPGGAGPQPQADAPQAAVAGTPRKPKVQKPAAPAAVATAKPKAAALKVAAEPPVAATREPKASRPQSGKTKA
ncbi:MAG: twin-arginine translocase subunit TatB [Rhodobacter sp.]|nr:twin-arginine translocase subunit TatB [Rhodobacter sp.]